MMEKEYNRAIDYFLDEETVCAEVDYPDRGIDFAYMLTISDMNTLLSKWEIYCNAWKSAITYFAGFLPLEESGLIIFKALFESDEKIVSQALFSIYESISAEIAHKSKPDYNFSETERKKILLELEKRRPVFKTYPELQQLHDFLS
jgi:hypothetical protein